MKHFECGFLMAGMPGQHLPGISAFLDLQNRQQVNQFPWGCNGGHRPEVDFAMVHDKSGIYLKYHVLENVARAVYKNFNDPVYKDSCVEVFLAFNGEKEYYNLEFNCAGVVLGGYGGGKLNREEISDKILKEIKTLSNIQPKKTSDKLQRWELAIYIPFTVFIHHQLSGLTGTTCRANFFKCGDDLPEPHFMTWAPVTYPYPEFHLPEFFGTIKFL